MEKAHVAAGVVHFVVSVTAPKFLGVFTQFCPSPPQFFLAFLHSFARRRLKNWISVGDRITGLFPCMKLTPVFVNPTEKNLISEV